MRKRDGDTINIRPGVSILAILPHLNYRPWYAMAEFVDNSVQSFVANREAIERAESRPVRLSVSIRYDASDDRITIRDNAAGICASEYARAFRPAAIPPDRSGLSEFGMGMKSAACWFARKWTVRSKALGESMERMVRFDIDAIVRDDIEELQIDTRPEDASRHYTEIVLYDLHNSPKGRTVRKIKDHLASIYRVFMRQGLLLLRFDDELLTYEDPRVLCAPFYRDPSGPAIVWRKPLDIDLGLGMRATGFAALRETASTSSAGLALFRRDRLIEGSGDEAYRPQQIFGHPNSYTFQRLFGELQLEGFDVSHTKDGFRWKEHEDVFLDLLRDTLDELPVPLLDQADGYRARLRPKDLASGAEGATRRTAETLQRELPAVFPHQLSEVPDASAPPGVLGALPTVSRRAFEVDLGGVPWVVEIELTADPAMGDWIELADSAIARREGPAAGFRCVAMRLSLSHPFMERFAGTDPARIEPILRIAAGIMLAEVAARNGGVRQAGTIRRNLNELLRHALSKP